MVGGRPTGGGGLGEAAFDGEDEVASIACPSRSNNEAMFTAWPKL